MWVRFLDYIDRISWPKVGLIAAGMCLTSMGVVAAFGAGNVYHFYFNNGDQGAVNVAAPQQSNAAAGDVKTPTQATPGATAASPAAPASAAPSVTPPTETNSPTPSSTVTAPKDSFLKGWGLAVTGQVVQSQHRYDSNFKTEATKDYMDSRSTEYATQLRGLTAGLTIPLSRSVWIEPGVFVGNISTGILHSYQNPAEGESFRQSLKGRFIGPHLAIKGQAHLTDSLSILGSVQGQAYQARLFVPADERTNHLTQVKYKVQYLPNDIELRPSIQVKGLVGQIGVGPAFTLGALTLAAQGTAGVSHIHSNKFEDNRRIVGAKRTDWAMGANAQVMVRF